MGIGDEIMVTGEVRRLLAQHGGTRVAVRARNRPDWHRWHPVWEGNPHIARPGEKYDLTYDNAPGDRPYIETKLTRRWVWREYRPIVGELFLSEREQSFAQLAEGCIVVQPFIKAGASPNKRWPLEFWQELVSRQTRWPWVQIGDGADPKLAGVSFLQTPSFRDACGVLRGARAAVLQEGGLHHAAAALAVPSVVIFGGYISPRVTGYETQRNLYVDDADHPLGCGARTPCNHCFRAMLNIKPTTVLKNLEEILDEHRS